MCHAISLTTPVNCFSTVDQSYSYVRRSLSEVPKGLRPIRTTSGRVGVASPQGGDDQVHGFVARLKRARQQALRQTGNQQASQPTPARVSLLT